MPMEEKNNLSLDVNLEGGNNDNVDYIISSKLEDILKSNKEYKILLLDYNVEIKLAYLRLISNQNIYTAYTMEEANEIIKKLKRFDEYL